MKNRGGRPEKAIDWDMLEKLCSIQATQQEIEFMMQIDIETIDKACKRKHKMGFSDFYDWKRSFGKVSLRRAMFKRAMEGSEKLMIWLSQNHLNMSGKMESKNENTEVERVFVSEWTNNPLNGPNKK